MRPQLLEPMPPMERDKTLAATPGTPTTTATTAVKENGLTEVAQEERNPILDLLGLDDGGAGNLLSQPAGVPVSNSTTALDDILGLNLGSSGPTMQPQSSMSLLDLAAPTTNPTPATNGGLDNLLNGLDTTSISTPAAEVPPLTAYEKHGLRVVFTFPSVNPTTTTITLMAHNLTNGPIQDFVFQVIRVEASSQ